MKSKRYYAQNAAIIILALAIIVMSVGYATYNASLNLNGTTTVQSSKWSVIFENPQKHASSTIDDSQITKFELTDSTTLTFNANMGIGDTYSFVVDVVNDGTFDAKLVDWVLTAKNTTTNEPLTINDAQTNASNSYLTYTVKWLDGTELAANTELPHKVAGSTTTVAGSAESETPTNVKKLQVTVQTSAPANVSELPTADQSFEFNFQMNFATLF